MAVMEKELQALQTVIQALKELDPPARKRLLLYAAQVFDEVIEPPQTAAPSRLPEVVHAAPTDRGFSEFAELFAAAEPTTDKERALVAAYWAQVVLGEGSFVSQTLNTQLKHLGHGVGNITDALDRLMEERPQLVLQLRKEGSTKQARKIYKVTHEGEKRVLAMINRRSNNE